MNRPSGETDCSYRGQGCSLFAATPTTFSRKEPMQPTRQAPQGSVPPTSQGEGLPRPFFHQREAHLRLPPPFCFLAPETSKPTPDRIATLVVTQSATAPHHCAAPLPTALDSAADPTCPLSKEEPQTLEHWLQRCPNLDVLRQHTFGPSPPLGVLMTEPETVLALARATF